MTIRDIVVIKTLILDYTSTYRKRRDPGRVFVEAKSVRVIGSRSYLRLLWILVSVVSSFGVKNPT